LIQVKEIVGRILKIGRLVPRAIKMVSYRCYRMNTDGHVIGVELFDASDDSTASIRARKLARELRWDAVQLWEAGRRIVLPLIQTPAAPASTPL
jgi:hypothetical protein